MTPSLTNQIKERFKEYFANYPALWHSDISEKNKRLIWHGIANHKINLVLGARSSLFLPFKKLGLIIIDEEHDQSYKQEDQIKFDAEFDRVYLNTRDTCVIHDEGFNRKITIQKQNSESTVIWTPWDKKVKTMVDMGTEDEWKKMICVESVNALENSVMVYPNESHNLIAEYLVQEY